VDEELQVDERIARLVRVVDFMRGIEVTSACGGHAEPQEGQVPEGEFSVYFYVHLNYGGWDSLGLITDAAYKAYLETEYAGYVDVVAWTGDEGPETLQFEIRGTSGADPDVLAEYLEAFPFVSGSRMSRH